MKDRPVMAKFTGKFVNTNVRQTPVVRTGGCHGCYTTKPSDSDSFFPVIMSGLGLMTYLRYRGCGME
jgi:hypothetical protein